MNTELTFTDDVLQEIETTGNFSIKTLPDNINYATLTKIPVDSGTKMQLSGLVQQLPNTVAAANSYGLYSVSFPDGLPHTLTALKQGGYGSMIKDVSGKNFAGSASFYKATTQAILLSSFTAISIVTGQYFLAEINKSMKIINQKLDKILEFLYGDKKAELIAEINFTRYAYQNYTSIMQSDCQRTATITSLQESRKVAMKDLEFYMNDLDSAVNADAKLGNTMDEVVNKTFLIYESVDLALQLYAISSLLEIYYSQNLNTSYLNFLSEELDFYIDKCDKRALADFSVLKRRLDDFKTLPAMKGKLNKNSLSKKIDAQIELLHNSGNVDKYKEIQDTIKAFVQPVNYIMNENGELFYQQESA